MSGKYPPDVIIENPANLHSETVTSDLENNLRGKNNNNINTISIGAGQTCILRFSATGDIISNQ